MELREMYWGNEEERTPYAMGHVNIDAFAEAAGRRIGANAADVKPNVLHLWGRWVPDTTGHFDRKMVVAGGPGRGVFAFTILDC